MLRAATVRFAASIQRPRGGRVGSVARASRGRNAKKPRIGA